MALAAISGSPLRLNSPIRGGGWEDWVGRRRIIGVRGPWVPLLQKCRHLRPQIGVERPDRHGDHIRWGRPLRGLGPAPSQAPRR